MKSLKLWMMAAIFVGFCGSCGDTEEDASSDSGDFVMLTDVVPDAILEIRYYGTYNFVGTRIDGYEEPTAMLTRQAAFALKAVSDDVKQLGFRLKIYDAYRPQKGVDNFVRWAADIPDTLMKKYFYPDLDKSVLFEQEYIYENNPETGEYTGNNSKSPTGRKITAKQFANRMILRRAMMAHGFKPLDTEWWHFTLKDEPYPDTYFTFPVKNTKK